MNKKVRHLPGLILTIIFTCISLLFLYLLYDTKIVPQMYMAVIAAVFALLVLISGCLVWNFRHIIRFSIGTLLIVLMSGVLILGGSYIRQTTRTLSRISGTSTETSHVGIYVKTDDPAQELSDASNYTFGILQSLDRPVTDETVALMNDELNTSVATVEYPGLGQLIKGFSDGEVNAFILNQAYWDVLDELGYSKEDPQIRELADKIIESSIEQPAVAASQKTPEPEHKQTEAPATHNGQKVYTIYLSGIDSRNGLTAKSRSDVNIIATINTETRQIVLISTPRDYFVPLSISNGVPDKLTHAGIYGINVCMDTLGLLYDTDINYYFRLNFDGFINIIDALGGITINSDYDFDSNGYHFNKGENEIDGAAALAFVRERYSFQDGDRQRGRNQMIVIRSVIAKVLSPELLTNYSSILKAVEGSFETNISYEEIAAQLQRQIKDGGKWNVVTYSTDGTGDTQKPYSMSQAAYVMVPDTTTVEKAKELIRKVQNGETVTQEETTASE